MPLQETSGTASYDAFGGGAPAAANYIEDVFSTYLYTGNGSAQTITNGIDLAGKGGLVWLKSRGFSQSHGLFDTARGENPYLCTDLTDGQFNFNNGVIYNANGFTNKSNSYFGGSFGAGGTYVSWTFRKQPKFFDVVTYTGNGSTQTIAHSLGSAPGFIVVKRTDSGGTGWVVYHRGLGTTSGYPNYVVLNSTGAESAGNASLWAAAPTSTNFTVGNSAAMNASGGTYVAYLFAHNAGGFGLTGTDNVISCGSFTTDGSGNATVNLGYEPQWLLSKSASGTSSWYMNDTMRGWTSNTSGSNMRDLYANTSDAEADDSGFIPTSTGFTYQFAANTTYIYIAIRRGPMKTPTSGGSVFSIEKRDGNSNKTVIGGTSPVVTDSYIVKAYNSAAVSFAFGDRLRGNFRYLESATTGAEITQTDTFTFNESQFGVTVYADDTNGICNRNGRFYINYFLKRAPGFFDEVCYTGTGSAHNETHNLGVVPELIIVKGRSAAFGWATYSATLGIGNYLTLNTVNASGADPGNVLWNNVAPTSTTFSVGTNATVNGSGSTYVAYLFASCPGVSKVGSYTGNGSSQTINCGFTGGARFVMIKRTDSTGDWYVWDTARGMVSGTDPSLLLNSTAAEVNANSVYTTTGGFQIVSTAAGINASGGSYIFLAIA